MMQLGRKKGVWGTLVLALGFTWIRGRDIAKAGRQAPGHRGLDILPNPPI